MNIVGKENTHRLRLPRKRRAALAASLALLMGISAVGIGNAGSASAANYYDNKDPKDTGCALDGIPGPFYHILSSSGQIIGQAQVLRSPTCQTAWSLVMSYGPTRIKIVVQAEQTPTQFYTSKDTIPNTTWAYSNMVYSPVAGQAAAYGGLIVSNKLVGWGWFKG